MRRRSEPNELRRTLLQLSLAIDNASSYVRSLRKTQRKPEASFRSTSGSLPVHFRFGGQPTALLLRRCSIVFALFSLVMLTSGLHLACFRFTLGLFPVWCRFQCLATETLLNALDAVFFVVCFRLTSGQADVYLPCAPPPGFSRRILLKDPCGILGSYADDLVPTSIKVIKWRSSFVSEWSRTRQTSLLTRQTRN